MLTLKHSNFYDLFVIELFDTLFHRNEDGIYCFRRWECANEFIKALFAAKEKSLHPDKENDDSGSFACFRRPNYIADYQINSKSISALNTANQELILMLFAGTNH